MIKNVFFDKEIIARLEANPLKQDLDVLATHMVKQGYARKSICQYLRKLETFGWWLERKGIQLHQLSEGTVQRYLQSPVKESKLSNRVQRKSAISALAILFRRLQETGTIRVEAPLCDSSELTQWLKVYAEYMEKVQGLALGTRRQYLRYANRFLNEHAENGSVLWSKLTATSIVEFILSDVANRTGFGPQRTTQAVRALLRFLIARSILPQHLQYAVPRIRRWSHATLPTPLSEKDAAKLIRTSAPKTAIEHRNFAILLLLLRLGLRANEVNRLELNDFDWSTGSILVRAGKAHRERRLPLPQDVGNAIVNYLRSGRPQSTCRNVFVTHAAPFSQFQGASAIWHITRKLVSKAGIDWPSGGAHVLRHTAATRMVNKGATFKDVADVLGHRRLHTTAIYAKLDILTLSAVALPWPCEVQQ